MPPNCQPLPSALGKLVRGRDLIQEAPAQTCAVCQSPNCRALRPDCSCSAERSWLRWRPIQRIRRRRRSTSTTYTTSETTARERSACPPWLAGCCNCELIVSSAWNSWAYPKNGVRAMLGIAAIPFGRMKLSITKSGIPMISIRVRTSGVSLSICACVMNSLIHLPETRQFRTEVPT